MEYSTAHTDWQLPPVPIGISTYLDKVCIRYYHPRSQILYPKKLPREIRDTLRATCGTRFGTKNTVRTKPGEYIRRTKQGTLIYHRRFMELNLCQPEDDALRVIEDYFRDEGIGYRFALVEFAMDLLYDDPDDVLKMDEFLKRHLCQRYSRRGVTGCEGTRYRKPEKKRGGQIVEYRRDGVEGRCSKIDGRPCFHMEYRAIGHAHARDLKVCSVDDLRTFDHLSLWDKKTTLKMIDLRKFARQRIGVGRRQRDLTDSQRRRIAFIVHKFKTLSRLENGDPAWSTQQAIYEIKRHPVKSRPFRPTGVVNVIPWRELIQPA